MNTAMKGALAALLLWPAWCVRHEVNLDLPDDWPKLPNCFDPPADDDLPWEKFTARKLYGFEYDSCYYEAMDVERGAPVILQIMTDAEDKHHGLRKCELVQSMMSQVSKHPEGKDKICRCLEKHAPATARKKLCAGVAEGWHRERRLKGRAGEIPDHCAAWPEFFETRNEHRSARDLAEDVRFPVLVFEFCGERGSSLDGKRLEQQKYIKGRWPKAEWLAKVRKWIKSLLEAVAFMSSLDPPVMHLNLALNNVAVTDADEVKITGFNQSVPVTEYSCETWDWSAVPPEWHEENCKRYSAEDAWAYDVWGVGKIYLNLICKETTPYHRGLVKTHCEDKFQDKSLGYGTEEDWAVIAGSLSYLEDRKSPEALLKILPA